MKLIHLAILSLLATPAFADTFKPLEAAGLNGNYLTPDTAVDVLTPFSSLTAFFDNGSYPLTGGTFIVTDDGAKATREGLVATFRADLINAEVGRKVEFYIIDPADAYRVKYASGLINAESAGVFEFQPSTPLPIAIGEVVGVHVANISTANGLHFRTSGGNSVAESSSTEGRLMLDATYAPTSNGPQRQFFIGADVASKALLVGRLWQDQPGGYVGVSADGGASLARAVDLPWKGKKICWYGTSIPACSLANSYPAIVGRALQAEMDNQSVGSSGVIWNGTRIDSLSATIAEIDALAPGAGASRSYKTKLLGKAADLVVFDHGHNDAVDDIANIASTDRSTFFGAMNFLIAELYADNPSVKIVFVTPPSRHLTGGTDNTQRSNILALADRWNAPVIDLARLCSFNAANDDLWFPDGVHPSQDAIDHISRILYHWLKGL